MRTSYSDYRNNYLVIIKRFLLRIRNIYDANISKIFPPDQKEFPEDYHEIILSKINQKQIKPNLPAMLVFLGEIFKTLNSELRPGIKILLMLILRH